MCATPAARRAVLKQSWEISKPFSLEPGIGKKDASTQERRQKNVNNTKMRNIVAGKYILLIHSSEQDLRPGPNLPKKFHHKNQKMCIACRKQVAVVIQDFFGGCSAIPPLDVRWVEHVLQKSLRHCSTPLPGDRKHNIAQLARRFDLPHLDNLGPRPFERNVAAVERSLNSGLEEVDVVGLAALHV